MAGPLIADTGGILRAIAKRPNGRSMWPEFERALRTASRVVVPALVLVEVAHFLRRNRRAMHELLAEISARQTTYAFQATIEETRAIRKEGCNPCSGPKAIDGLQKKEEHADPTDG